MNAAPAAARCIALVLTTLLAPAGAPAAEPDPAAIVREAVKVLAAERAGLTAFREHYDYSEYGPGHSKTLVQESGRLREDGRLVTVRLYASIANGKTASASELAKLQAELDKELPADDYRLPLTGEALSDYRFESSSTCNDCPPGSVAIAFVSLKRDSDHGDGTAIVDEPSHHVERLEFRPSVFPSHVDKAKIVLAFGRVLPGLWDLVSTESHYSGHMLFLHGGADISQSNGGYRRFQTMDEARKALASGM